MKKNVELKFIDSIHEQREYNKRLLPILGSWLELGKFTPVKESFDIDERWECIGHEKSFDEESVEITLKKIDHKKEEEKAKKIISDIMDKHGTVLTDSFFMAIIEGFHHKRVEIALTDDTFSVKQDKVQELDDLKDDIDERVEHIKKAKKKEDRLIKKRDRLINYHEKNKQKIKSGEKTDESSYDTYIDCYLNDVKIKKIKIFIQMTSDYLRLLKSQHNKIKQEVESWKRQEQNR